MILCKGGKDLGGGWGRRAVVVVGVRGREQPLASTFNRLSGAR